MDRIEIYQEIRSMQITYIFHFIFYVLLGIEHLLIILKIFWNSKIHIKFFISCSIIDLIFLLYPIIPLVLIYRIILKKNLAKIFRLISLIIIILSLIIGIIINIFFWLNLKETTSFSRECPYNVNDIKIFLGEEDTTEKCLNRRCILESLNGLGDYPYNYICNYNSQKDFEIDPNAQYPVKQSDGSIIYLKYYIQCQEKNSIEELFTDKNNINNDNVIYIYLKKCWDNNDMNGFYLCQRYEFPNKYEVEENYKCPKDNYNIILYLCGIFLIVLDIIFAFIPWSLDYKSYSRILLFDNSQNENLELDSNENNENNNEQQRRRHNETNTSSNNNPNSNNNERNNNQNENNINNNNSNRGTENNNENFIHQPTETIIIVKDRKTNNNSSNIRSDRLNSGLNSNDYSKSNVNNSNSSMNKRKNKKGNEIISGSMISQSESQNMISKNSGKDESEDKKLVLNNHNINLNINNKEDEIKFNNDIKYDDYKNNEDEDEKDIEDRRSSNNCLIQNKNINININTRNKKQNIVLTNEVGNINIKETANSIITTIPQKYKDENCKNNKKNDISPKSENFENIGQIEDITGNYRNKTPKKEIKSLNFNFSQVLTNIRDSDQITLFNNTNGSIIKEERKEDTERSKKEEEKNNSNKSKMENKKINSSVLTPFKIKNRQKNKENEEEKKYNTIDNITYENQSSLLGENSNKSENIK